MTPQPRCFPPALTHAPTLTPANLSPLPTPSSPSPKDILPSAHMLPRPLPPPPLDIPPPERSGLRLVTVSSPHHHCTITVDYRPQRHLGCAQADLLARRHGARLGPSRRRGARLGPSRHCPLWQKGRAKCKVPPGTRLPYEQELAHLVRAKVDAHIALHHALPGDDEAARAATADMSASRQAALRGGDSTCNSTGRTASSCSGASRQGQRRKRRKCP